MKGKRATAGIPESVVDAARRGEVVTTIFSHSCAVFVFIEQKEGRRGQRLYKQSTMGMYYNMRGVLETDGVRREGRRKENDEQPT